MSPTDTSESLAAWDTTCPLAQGMLCILQAGLKWGHCSPSPVMTNYINQTAHRCSSHLSVCDNSLLTVKGGDVTSSRLISLA